MNTITHIDKQGDRLYLTVILDGLKEVEVKLYAPYPKTSILAIVDQAVNHNLFAAANYNEDEDDQCENFMHEEFVKNIIAFFKKSKFKNIQVIGIHDKDHSLKFRLTELGKKSFVYYAQDGVSALDWTLSISQNKSEALYAMTNEMMSVTKYDWKDGVKKSEKTTSTKLDKMISYSIVVGEKYVDSRFLVSVDSIEEFLKYKSLSPESLEILLKAGLLEDCENNEFWKAYIKTYSVGKVYEILDNIKIVDDASLQVTLTVKN